MIDLFDQMMDQAKVGSIIFYIEGNIVLRGIVLNITLSIGKKLTIFSLSTCRIDYVYA